MARRKWTKEEIEEYRKKHGEIFYFNKEDSNLLVPKAYGIGRTLNWANPISWILILAIICFVIFRKFF
jgi:uncharacterized membrane protein